MSRNDLAGYVWDIVKKYVPSKERKSVKQHIFNKFMDEEGEETSNDVVDALNKVYEKRIRYLFPDSRGRLTIPAYLIRELQAQPGYFFVVKEKDNNLTLQLGISNDVDTSHMVDKDFNLRINKGHYQKKWPDASTFVVFKEKKSIVVQPLHLFMNHAGN